MAQVKVALRQGGPGLWLGPLVGGLLCRDMADGCAGASELLTLGLVPSPRRATGPHFCGVSSASRAGNCGWWPPTSLPCLPRPQLLLGALAAPLAPPSFPHQR